MKISITPTNTIEMVNGVRCREWIGISDQGVPCNLYVAMVKVKGGENQESFERELNEVKSDRQLSYFDNRILE